MSRDHREVEQPFGKVGMPRSQTRPCWARQSEGHLPRLAQQSDE